MRQSEQFGRDHARLREPKVVRLQTGQQQIEAFGLCGGGYRGRYAERVELVERRVFQVNAAVGPPRQSLLDHRLHARRAERERDHLAAMLLLELQGGLQPVGVRFVDLISQIAILNPRSLFVDPKNRIGLRHLFQTDNDFHDNSYMLSLGAVRGAPASGSLDDAIIRQGSRSLTLPVLRRGWEKSKRYQIAE